MPWYFAIEASGAGGGGPLAAAATIAGATTSWIRWAKS